MQTTITMDKETILAHIANELAWLAAIAQQIDFVVDDEQLSDQLTKIRQVVEYYR